MIFDCGDLAQELRINNSIVIYLTIFKSTKNYPIMCVGLQTKNPTNVGLDVVNYLNIIKDNIHQ